MLPDWVLTPLVYGIVVLILAALVAEAVGVRPTAPEPEPAEDESASRYPAIQRRRRRSPHALSTMVHRAAEWNPRSESS